ncbi:RebB family R body protein [Chryseobacterium sp. OSA05B]|uniref:RebB family R body protein n=1 Tax=Chryseobacterium sp. OSA05B TaxID=2862650 RepID=UPI001CBFAC9C|nr:RebB family R body protein [Chryseobacterium sp. OSA05B]
MNEINTAVMGMSASVPAAISMQVSAHSIGLMHINSALNQQRDAMLGMSNYVMGLKKMSSGRIKLKGSIAGKGRF